MILSLMRASFKSEPEQNVRGTYPAERSSPMTRILSLDLSLTRSGVCRVLSRTAGQPCFTVETVHCEPLRVPGARPDTTRRKERTGTLRLLWWKQWLLDEVRMNDFGLVAMEAPALYAPGKKFDKAEQYAIVKVTLAELGVPLVVVPIKTIKLYACGRGDADKLRMLDSAFVMFGMQVKTEDDADAAWLCRLACQWQGDLEDDLPFRLAAVATVEKVGVDQ